MSSIVAFEPSIEPEICWSLVNDPTTFSNFNNNVFSSHPPSTTNPVAFPCVIVSPSKNLTFSNLGSNETRSSFLTTLPNSLLES